jgi:hypothetical protein
MGKKRIVNFLQTKPRTSDFGAKTCAKTWGFAGIVNAFFAVPKFIGGGDTSLGEVTVAHITGCARKTQPLPLPPAGDMASASQTQQYVGLSRRLSTRKINQLPVIAQRMRTKAEAFVFFTARARASSVFGYARCSAFTVSIT